MVAVLELTGHAEVALAIEIEAVEEHLEAVLRVARNLRTEGH
jgi:hypothetical protein